MYKLLNLDNTKFCQRVNIDVALYIFSLKHWKMGKTLYNIHICYKTFHPFIVDV